MIIAAGGVASRVSCTAGINKPLKLAEMASCLAWRFKGVKLPDPYKCVTDFPRETHPFYTSVIPSGPDEALIGLGLLSSRGHACRPTLERVMERYPYMRQAWAQIPPGAAPAGGRRSLTRWSHSSACTSCGKCITECRMAAIGDALRSAAHTSWGTPLFEIEVDAMLCTGCGLCEASCPLPGQAAIQITARGARRPS